MLMKEKGMMVLEKTDKKLITKPLFGLTDASSFANLISYMLIKMLFKYSNYQVQNNFIFFLSN